MSSPFEKVGWQIDYFEVRYEDQNQNKKYFYPFVGEG